MLTLEILSRISMDQGSTRLPHVRTYIVRSTASPTQNDSPFLKIGSHFTNAHSLPGDSIVQGLKEVGLPLSRGLLLLAEMSSQGCLATDEYAQETLKMAVRHSDFVFGFIGQRRLPLPQGVDTDFLYMTPGVQVQSKGDALGQQYRTPHEVLVESGWLCLDPSR